MSVSWDGLDIRNIWSKFVRSQQKKLEQKDIWLSNDLPFKNKLMVYLYFKVADEFCYKSMEDVKKMEVTNISRL